MSLYTSLPECTINFLQHVGYNSESDVLLMLFLPACHKVQPLALVTLSDDPSTGSDTCFY